MKRFFMGIIYFIMTFFWTVFLFFLSLAKIRYYCFLFAVLLLEFITVSVLKRFYRCWKIFGRDFPLKKRLCMCKWSSPPLLMGGGTIYT